MYTFDQANTLIRLATFAQRNGASYLIESVGVPTEDTDHWIVKANVDTEDLLCQCAQLHDAIYTAFGRGTSIWVGDRFDTPSGLMNLMVAVKP